MNWRVPAVALLTALLAGCTGYSRPQPAFHQVLVDAYRLDSGDRLRVTVFGQPDLTSSYTVDQSGHIAFPLVGTLSARGTTTAELDEMITTALRDGYLRHPDVSVEVDQYRPFFIMGEVRNAGQYNFVPGMTAQMAIAMAGGFTARGYQNSVDITRQINGEIVVGRVSLSDPIRPGDTITIRERFF
jgi:polysaccharide biosynthesis/export protein